MTIVCDLVLIDGQAAQLRELFGWSNCTGVETLYVELRDPPDVLGPVDPVGSRWTVTRITPAGLALYTADPNKGDGGVFVPMSNVKAFHTLGPEWEQKPVEGEG